MSVPIYESPLLWVSLVWIIIAIVGSILVKFTDDPPLYRLAIWTGCICLWLMWLIVFLSQINPLLAPQLKVEASSGNETSARSASL